MFTMTFLLNHALSVTEGECSNCQELEEVCNSKEDAVSRIQQVETRPMKPFTFPTVNNFSPYTAGKIAVPSP